MTESITTKPITTSRDTRAFVRFPRRIYADDPNWVPPLEKKTLELLDQHKHPFWQHAKGRLFLACKNGSVAGRICAHIDHNYVNHWNEKTGSFGFFECVDDQAVANALFNAAAEWLREQGMTLMRGPMSPSATVEFGFLTDGFDRPPAFLTSYNPAYYPALAEAWGFRRVKWLWAYEKDCRASPTPDIIYKVARRLKNNPHISVNRLGKKNFAAGIRVLTDLLNECWSEHWAFSPVTYEEMIHDMAPLRRFWEEEMSVLACYDGVPVGMTIILPDVNELLHRLGGTLGPLNLIRALRFRRRFTRCRSLLLGFKEQYRGLGLPALLYCEVEAFVRRHYDYIEFSWIHEDDRLMNGLLHHMATSICARYSVMERTL